MSSIYQLPVALAKELRRYVLKEGVLQFYRGEYMSTDLWYDVPECPFVDLIKWVQNTIHETSGMSCVSAWCFLYNAVCDGVPIHADDGKVTVNIWLTPTSHVIDEEKNGLRLFNVSAPSSWSFETANGDPCRIRKYIEKQKGVSYVIPYEYRRVVVFPSNTFHETDQVHTKAGKTQRRLSCTLLFSY